MQYYLHKTEFSEDSIIFSMFQLTSIKTLYYIDLFSSIQYLGNEVMESNEFFSKIPVSTDMTLNRLKKYKTFFQSLEMYG